MSSYHIWITTPISSYESGIIKGLVSKGYIVSAANGDIISLTYEGSPSIVIALRVEKSIDVSAKDVYNDIAFVLLELEAKYYSVVVSLYSHESTWCCGNFVSQELETLRTPSPDKLN